MTAAICPDCRAGKHRNCTGEAWDAEADQPTTCHCSCRPCDITTDGWCATHSTSDEPVYCTPTTKETP